MPKSLSPMPSPATHTMYIQFPDYARFLISTRLQEFSMEMIQLSREADIPMLKYLESLPEDKLIDLNIKSAVEILNSIINNKTEEHIQHSQERWKANQLPQIERGQIVVEDITLLNHIRKIAFLKFIPEYTNDTLKIIELVKEIDNLILRNTTSAFKTFTDLLESRIHEQAYLNEKITNTLPGVVYIYDCLLDRLVYANKNFTEHLGYSFQDFQNISDNIIEKMVHPEDLDLVSNSLLSIAEMQEGTSKVIECRVKTTDGNYIWQRSYLSVFKTTDSGEVWQAIGVAFNVEKEKQTGAQLQKREAQLLEAQALANIGSFEWNLETLTGELTRQAKIILDLDDGDHLHDFYEKVHSEDKERVQSEIEKTIKDSSIYDCEYRYKADTEKIIWSRGSVLSKQGKRFLQGTIIDVTLRHYTVQQLKHSEELFKQAQAITHIGNYVWDLKKNKLSWSDELYRIYNLPPGSDIDNEQIARYNHPEDTTVIQEQIQRSKETFLPFDFHYRIILPDNTIKILHALGKTIPDNDGKAYKIIGTAQDVTERQTLFQRIQQSENLYKQAQAIAHIGNWEWDITNDKIIWTDELYRIYEIEPQSREITFEEFIDLVHPEDRDVVAEETLKSLRDMQPNEFFHRILLDNGNIKILHAKSEVRSDEYGKLVTLVGTAQDVTQQKHIEKKLRENQIFIQKIADATPSIIASYNINTGKYVFINQGVKKLLGYDPQKILDEGLQFLVTLIHPEDVGTLMEKSTEALEKANAQKLSDGEEFITEFQYRMRHSNGEYRWFHTFGTVFDRDDQHKVQHLLNISLDITERIKAEQVLYQRTLELQRSNANLEEFAFVASHDLKEPLRKISTFSDRLLTTQREHITPDGLVYLEKIMNSSVRMQQMINDLLSLSIISGDKSFVRCSLTKIWQEVLVTFEHKIEETKASFEITNLPEVYVVPSQFRQLFQNLLSNALKFARSGVPPVITLTHQLLSLKDVQSYHLSDDKKYLQLKFSDNGIGFDNAYAEKIFAIFQRLHHKEAYDGTGIGLAICKKIVENHGGIISATGVQHHGSTFTIVFPY
jgi:PAS domain S-box-containing protein